jgi:hypothetical protein
VSVLLVVVSVVAVALGIVLLLSANVALVIKAMIAVAAKLYQ